MCVFIFICNKIPKNFPGFHNDALYYLLLSVVLSKWTCSKCRYFFFFCTNPFLREVIPLHLCISQSMRHTPDGWPFWRPSHWHFLAKLFVTWVTSALSWGCPCCSKGIHPQYECCHMVLDTLDLQQGRRIQSMASQISFSGHPIPCSCEDFCKGPKFESQSVHPVHLSQIILQKMHPKIYYNVTVCLRLCLRYQSKKELEPTQGKQEQPPIFFPHYEK